MVNVLSILVAAIAGFLLGGFWYGPLFSKRWIKLQGWTAKELAAMKKSGKNPMIWAFFTSLVMATVLAYFISWARVGSPVWTFWCGPSIGLVAWVGFIGTTFVNNTVFGRNKSWPLFWIDAGHYLVGLLLMGAILGAWY